MNGDVYKVILLEARGGDPCFEYKAGFSLKPKAMSTTATIRFSSASFEEELITIGSMKVDGQSEDYELEPTMTMVYSKQLEFGAASATVAVPILKDRMSELLAEKRNATKA